MRDTFANGEYYHIYNRGVDKREVFQDPADFERFLQSLKEFNALEPIGSIYEHTYAPKLPPVSTTTPFGSPTSKPLISEHNSFGRPTSKKLVNIICYCLNPNHYHLLLEQLEERGVERFMQRLGTGYSKYFNHKARRSGALFQGKYKSKHIDSNDYLLHLSSYINLNYKAHGFGSPTSKSSWEEYRQNVPGVCEKEVILKQFPNGDYAQFAEDSLTQIIERKQTEKSFAEACLEE